MTQNEYKKVITFFSSLLFIVILISIILSFFVEKDAVITLGALGVALTFAGFIMASLFTYQNKRNKE